MFGRKLEAQISWNNTRQARPKEEWDFKGLPGESLPGKS